MQRETSGLDDQKQAMIAELHAKQKMLDGFVLEVNGLLSQSEAVLAAQVGGWKQETEAHVDAQANAGQQRFVQIDASIHATNVNAFRKWYKSVARYCSL